MSNEESKFKVIGEVMVKKFILSLLDRPLRKEIEALYRISKLIFSQ